VDSDDSFITPELLERARAPLDYEVRYAREKKPVLNLSARKSDALSLAEGFEGKGDDSSIENPDLVADCSWESGELWQETKLRLVSMGIVVNDEKILTRAPQLLRLPTDQITGAASFLLTYPYGTNSTRLIDADASLLTYLADDLQYGVEEYLPNMMFLGNQTSASAMIQTQMALAPSMALQLVRMGVEGGIEERSVSRALGSAGAASGKAVEGVVGEAGRSYREWKRVKGGKGSLG